MCNIDQVLSVARAHSKSLIITKALKVMSDNGKKQFSLSISKCRKYISLPLFYLGADDLIDLALYYLYIKRRSKDSFISAFLIARFLLDEYPERTDTKVLFTLLLIENLDDQKQHGFFAGLYRENRNLELGDEKGQIIDIIDYIIQSISPEDGVIELLTSLKCEFLIRTGNCSEGIRQYRKLAKETLKLSYYQRISEVFEELDLSNMSLLQNRLTSRLIA